MSTTGRITSTQRFSTTSQKKPALKFSTIPSMPMKRSRRSCLPANPVTIPVVPTAYFLERQIKGGVFQKLDKSKLRNLGNVWPDIAKRLAVYDPGSEFAVNYMWGTTGIGYNVKAMRERLGPEGKIDSWDIIFKPENLAKFRDCGIHMLDSADDILPAALHFLGLNPNSNDPKELEKAGELLMKIRPWLENFIRPNI